MTSPARANDGGPGTEGRTGLKPGTGPSGTGPSSVPGPRSPVVLLLPASLGLMTASWVSALLAMFSVRAARGETAAPPILLLFLWWLGGWFVTRWSLLQPWAERRGGLVVAVSGLIANLLGLWALYARPAYDLWDVRWLGALWDMSIAQVGSGLTVPLLAAIAGVLLWWRGIVAGREPYISYDAVYRGFGTGVVAWMVVLMVTGSGGGWAGLGGPLLLFFLAGLSGLALASLESVQRSAREQAGVYLGVNRFWLVAVSSVILTILALGVLLGTLLAPQSIAQLLGVFGPVVNALAQVVYLLFTAIVYILFFLLGPIIEFLRPRSPSTPPPTLQPDPFENFRREMERAAQNSQVNPPGWALALVQALLVIAILLAVLFFLSRAFRRLRALDAEGVEEIRESVGSWALLWAQLGELLRRLRRRRLLPAAPSPFLPLEVAPGEDGRLSIREAYRRLLALARERGHPRARPQTPYEYRATLKRAFPDNPAEVEAMTEAYVAARYGPTPPPEPVISRVNRAWRAIWSRAKGNGEN